MLWHDRQKLMHLAVPEGHGDPPLSMEIGLKHRTVPPANGRNLKLQYPGIQALRCCAGCRLLQILVIDIGVEHLDTIGSQQDELPAAENGTRMPLQNNDRNSRDASWLRRHVRQR